MSKKKTVAIDLDGVLAEYDGFKGVNIIGDPIPGARKFMEKLSMRFEVIVHTCRASVDWEGKHSDKVTREERINYIRKWLDENCIPYNDIWIWPGKPYASAYVDDRAVCVNKRHTKKQGPAAYDRAYEECLELIKGKK